MRNTMLYAMLGILGWSFTASAESEAVQHGHHDFPPAVSAFHDVMAPLWHAAPGAARDQHICQSAATLQNAADDILRADNPAKVQAADWGRAAQQLREAVASLSRSCERDRQQAASAMATVHDRFHALVAQVGHRHGEQPAAGNSATDEKDPDYLEIAQAFAECAALQNTLADLATDSEQAFEDHDLHKSAVDAITVAGDFARVGGHDPAVVELEYDSHIERFHGMLSQGEQAHKTFIEQVQPVVRRCTALHRVQAALIAVRDKQQH